MWRMIWRCSGWFVVLTTGLLACEPGFVWRSGPACDLRKLPELQASPLLEQTLGEGGKGLLGCVRVAWGPQHGPLVGAESRLVRLDGQGQLLAHPASKDPRPLFELPRRASEQWLRFRLFAFGRSLQDADPSRLAPECQAMGSPDYRCAPDVEGSCWFSMPLLPRLTSANPKLAPARGCQLNAPGVGGVEPGVAESGRPEPSPSEPSSSEPSSSEPGNSEPGSSEPGSSEPGSSEPGSSEPGSSEPGSSDGGVADSTRPLPDLTGKPTSKLWAVSAGGPKDVIATGVAVDAAGNIFITGYFTGQATFGQTTLRAMGSSDVFVAKLDSSGAWLWARATEGNGGSQAQAIAVDAAGSAYITGFVQQKTLFRPLPDSAVVPPDKTRKNAFVAKIDGSGTWRWVQWVRANKDTFGRGIAVTKGKVFITGSFTSSASFGQLQTLLTTEGQDAFVAWLGSSSGKWRGAQKYGGPGKDAGLALSALSTGGVLVTGYFTKSLLASNPSKTRISKGEEDAFALSLTVDAAEKAQVSWVTSGGSVETDKGLSIAADGKGGAVVGGFIGGFSAFGLRFPKVGVFGKEDAFVARVDSKGAWQWVLVAEGKTGNEQIQSVAIDADDSPYVFGIFFGTITLRLLPPVIFTPLGGPDLFVTRVQANGKGWNIYGDTKIGSSNAHERVGGIAVDPLKNVIVAGSFQSSLTRRGTTLISKGGFDLFVWKFR